MDGNERTGPLRAVTAQRHDKKSLTGGEGTLDQLNQDQLGFGISLAYLLCGSGLAFLQVEALLWEYVFMREEMESEWKLAGSQFKSQEALKSV